MSGRPTTRYLAATAALAVAGVYTAAALVIVAARWLWRRTR